MSKNIKLGAPHSIDISNGAPDLDNLDVQITERLELLTLKGNTGTKNPFARAAEMLRQQEVERLEEEGLRPDIEGLPRDFLPVEYITNTIRSNYANRTEGLDIDFNLTHHTISIKYDLNNGGGGYQGITNGGLDIRWGTSSGNVTVIGDEGSFGYQVLSNTLHEYTINPNVTNEDGVQVSTFDAVRNIRSVKLFGNASNYTQPGAKIYYFKATNIDTGDVDVYMIPVINRYTKKVYFYDVARHRFFDFDSTNIAYMNFEGGPVVHDTSISLNIPTDAILNGGNTKCEITVPKIPQEYQSVEYIEGTGTQSIELGDFDVDIPDDIDVRNLSEEEQKKYLYIEAKYDSLGNSINIFNRMYGTGNDDPNRWFSALSDNISSNQSVYANTKSGNLRLDIPAESVSYPSTISFYPSRLSAFGSSALFPYRFRAYEMRNIFLFGYYIVDTLNRVKYSFRLYHFKLVTKTRSVDMYPCYRKLDGKTGMYDVIGGAFYPCYGTEEFVLGDNIYDNPSKYYWLLLNIQGNSTEPPTIDQRGNITMEEGKWEQFIVKAKRYTDASWIKRLFVCGMLYQSGWNATKRNQFESWFNSDTRIANIVADTDYSLNYRGIVSSDNGFLHIFHSVPMQVLACSASGNDVSSIGVIGVNLLNFSNRSDVTPNVYNTCKSYDFTVGKIFKDVPLDFFQPNTQYTLSFYGYQTAQNGIIGFTHTDGTSVTTRAWQDEGIHSVTSTAGKTVRTIYCTYYQGGGDIYYKNMQINIGADVLDYSPFSEVKYSTSQLNNIPLIGNNTLHAYNAQNDGIECLINVEFVKDISEYI